MHRLLFVLGLFSCQLAMAQEAAPMAPATPPEDHPNRVVLWGGYGPDGLTLSQQGERRLVKPFLGPLVGVSYAHRIYEQVSINAQLISGASPSTSTYIWMGGIGYDF